MKHIDRNIVSNKYKHPENICKFTIFTCKKKRRWNNIHIPNNIKDYDSGSPELVMRSCFGGILGKMKSDIKINRIYYRVEKAMASFAEMQSWIRLNKKYKLLPPYIGMKNLKDCIFVFDINDCAISQLYMYLSTVRLLREGSGFVKAVIYLVNECKMNFYVAYILASKICVDFPGHHITDYTRDYGRNCDPNTIKIPIKLIIGLRRYTINPNRYDKRKVKDHTNNSIWNCTNTIREICKISDCYTVENLSYPLIEKAIMSDTDEEAIYYLKEFKKEGTNENNI